MRRRVVIMTALVVVVLAAAAVFLPISRDGGQPWVEEVPVAECVTDDLADRVTHEQARETLAFLDPVGQLAPWVTLSATAALVRVCGREVRVPLVAEPVPPTRPELRGMRVLLDPGHFGGAWSEIESRHVVAEGGEPVREGDLSWAVSRLVELKLTEAGAEVQLTRGAPPEQPFPHGLDPAFDPDHEAAVLLSERLDEPPFSSYRRLFPSLYGRLMLEKARRDIVEERGLFRLYNGFDLRRRSALGAGFDVTVSIHFNTTGPRRDNWVMAFVPGHVMRGEASTVSQRYWSLRRVFDGHWPEQVALARDLIAAMKRHMDLPSLDPKLLEEVPEPKKTVVDVEHGVFARNLAIVRRTPGVVVLLEGPCVDNEAEYQRLQDRSVEVDGRTYPKRVQEYADAVVDGLRSWSGD